MKKIIKQVVGIDVAQKELVVCLGRMYSDGSNERFATGTFVNNNKGFQALVKWVQKLTDSSVAVRFVMEATGVYHETLAYFLDERGYEVSIVLPNVISNYFRTLEVKTITDKSCSEAIALFGLERKLMKWKRPDQGFLKLRALTRERDQIVVDRTVTKNQLHAEEAGAIQSASSIKRKQKRISLLDQQEAEIKKEIRTAVNESEEIKKAILIIGSITGIGLLTAAALLGETNGFDLIRNKRQLASYAGLDVREKQSGTSVKGKARISKRGNKYLRKALHMPALTAVRHDERFKSIYARLIAKHGIKMKALVAIQRKLLEIAYIVYKNNEVYDKNYLQKQIIEELDATNI
jgi:transposase